MYLDTYLKYLLYLQCYKYFILSYLLIDVSKMKQISKYIIVKGCKIATYSYDFHDAKIIKQCIPLRLSKISGIVEITWQTDVSRYFIQSSFINPNRYRKINRTFIRSNCPSPNIMFLCYVTQNSCIGRNDIKFYVYRQEKHTST